MPQKLQNLVGENNSVIPIHICGLIPSQKKNK